MTELIQLGTLFRDEGPAPAPMGNTMDKVVGGVQGAGVGLVVGGVLGLVAGVILGVQISKFTI